MCRNKRRCFVSEIRSVSSRINMVSNGDGRIFVLPVMYMEWMEEWWMSVGNSATLRSWRLASSAQKFGCTEWYVRIFLWVLSSYFGGDVKFGILFTLATYRLSSSLFPCKKSQLSILEWKPPIPMHPLYSRSSTIHLVYITLLCVLSAAAIRRVCWELHQLGMSLASFVHALSENLERY